jgi:CRP/FNR family transcriptional regulator, cyclic AMP receptor protein
MAKDIRKSLLFEGVDSAQIEKFLSSLPEPIHLQKNAYLWRQNDPGHSMYILKSGTLEVLIGDKNEEGTLIASIEAGAVIGEVCVFGEKHRSASIRAAEDSDLLHIDGDKFLQKVREKDVGVLTMCYNVTKLLTQRLITANEFIRKIQMLEDKPAVKSELEHYRQRFFQESLFN